MPLRYHADIDRGYAWIILAASVLLECVANIATTGIFYAAILEKYQKGE